MNDPLSSALPDEIETLAWRLLERADARGLTLATAESCTGGLISSILTDCEGASHAFERGFVVYGDAPKTEMLGVPGALVDSEGAVSRAVAMAMAAGAIDRSHADVVLAVTGFAGPGGPNDEAGLVHFACIRRGREAAHREEHFGSLGRTRIRAEAARVAMEMMLDAIE